ncbi:MAG: hypothetical protein JSU04_00990 [Bdellovibrionales bacterium]|nr:hypothetical protein [Bdellovibrionales bacterium]
MKKRTISFGVLIIALIATYSIVDLVIEPPATREPASVPSNYESMKACEKQDVLWSKIEESAYKELPPNREFGMFQLMAMSKQEVGIKGTNYSDFAPTGWKKYLHGRASIAKVKLVPVAGTKYTGLLQSGAECGLLRVSLTYKPTGSRPVAPGLAFKIFRDGNPSTNISALVSLDGQGEDYNFFKYPLSNIVPVGDGFGQKMVHKIFLTATKYPEELGAHEFGEMDVHGQKVAEPVSPRQLFFVPGPGLSFPSTPHELREDYAKIPAGTVIYQVFAAPEKYNSFNYLMEYQPANAPNFLKESEHIADIVTTSSFVASQFGDDGIFFRHQLRPK